MKRFKYFYVEDSEIIRGTKAVHNNRSHDMLANIEWYAPWRQWVAQFSYNAIFSHDCLSDLAGYMRDLNKAGAPGQNKGR